MVRWHLQHCSFHFTLLSRYMLVMRDRYKGKVDMGILYYLKTGMRGMMLNEAHVRSLLIKRNFLASYIREYVDGTSDLENSLPAMLRNEAVCGRCYQVWTSCLPKIVVVPKRLSNSREGNPTFDLRSPMCRAVCM